MELSLSPSSLRLHHTTSSFPSHYNTKSSPLNISNTTKNSNQYNKILLRTSFFYTTTKTSSSRFFSNKHPNQFCIKACSQVGAAGSEPAVNKFEVFRDAFWRFLRPHTIRGTALGSVSLVTRALLENPNLIRWSLLFKAFSGLAALICGNGYIVGINQIYDIGIDKVNKPYLPIAAGDLSVKSAWFLVLAFAVLGVIIVGINFGPFITSLYCLGLFLGTIYSVPPLRMKRFPVVAFLIIATVRGFLLNFGVYYAVRTALGLTFQWSSPVAFITSFVTLFALVIAITKDLPDVEGDRKFQISNFATKHGVRNIALLGSGLLLINYIGSIVAAFYMPQAFRSSLMIPIHTILASCLIYQAWVLERANYTQAYQLDLPPGLDGIHNTFHVCYLRKCLAEEENVIPLTDIRVDPKKRLVEEPVEILDRKKKKFRKKQIELVLVKWKHSRGECMTWETESEMKERYPHLFDVDPILRT